MDVNFSMICIHTNKKPNEEHDMDGRSNIIDKCPDTILQHILSLLPTKDAVRTSILSKRWQYQWLSIPNLDFNEGLHAERQSFMNFVERVLISHDSLNIEKFSLTCNVLDDESRIDAWISAVIMHKVQELSICLANFEGPFLLPRCLFTCKSLTRLNIQMSYFLIVPPPVHFSSLKILTLVDVIFFDDHSTQQLFSGCPLLEDLHICQCNWKNLKTVIIYAPKLWRLTISDTDTETDILGRRLSNGCQVMIFASSLKYLCYTGALMNEYCLCNSSPLKADILVYGWHFQRQRQVAHSANKLLRGVSSVNELVLSSEIVQVLSDPKGLFYELPTFNNLTGLTVDGYLGLKSGAFPKLFEYFPCLRSLVFTKDFYFRISHGNNEGMLDWVPSCFSSHLQIVKIGEFLGDENDLLKINFLLKHATVLNKMILCCSEDLAKDFEKRNEIHEELLMLPRASVSSSIFLC